MVIFSLCNITFFLDTLEINQAFNVAKHNKKYLAFKWEKMKFLLTLFAADIEDIS